MNDEDHAQVRKAIESRMASFEAAERSLDAEALLAHFSNARDFYMHNDGHRLAFDEVAAAVRGAFPGLASLEGGFVGLDVQVLTKDAALATARFRETITTADGTKISQRGAASWLWRRKGDNWKIAYGHVDHYPEPTDQGAAQD